jgi:flagellar capping protein FliD
MLIDATSFVCLLFRQVSPPALTSILSEIKSSLNEDVKSTCSQDNDKIKQDLNALENRLQTYIDKRVLELQQHIDNRFDRLEEKLTKLDKNL